jgi:hypothetical protein
MGAESLTRTPLPGPAGSRPQHQAGVTTSLPDHPDLATEGAADHRLELIDVHRLDDVFEKAASRLRF